MKSTELRIGNYVKYNSSELKIWGILKNNVVELECNTDSLTIHDIEPIPVTTELLKRLRFYPEPHDIRFWRNGSIRLKITEKGFKFNYSISITYVHYLHQLQNIYLDLTGNELTLNGL